MRARAQPGAGDGLPPFDLTDRLRGLETLNTDELRAEWRHLRRASAPSCFNRDMLLRDLDYELQAVALGDLRLDTRRRLATLTRCATAGEAKAPSAAPPLRSGTTLVREWHGRAHTVMVLDAGFEHQGRRYASLTEIAREITGAHWSGPRFFGVTRHSRVVEGRAESTRDGDA